MHIELAVWLLSMFAMNINAVLTFKDFKPMFDELKVFAQTGFKCKDVLVKLSNEGHKKFVS